MNRSLLDTTTGFGLLLKKFYYMTESFKATCIVYVIRNIIRNVSFHFYKI